MIFLACPPVYTLPGTWSDPDKIAKCTETLIPHFTFNPDYTFGISPAVKKSLKVFLILSGRIQSSIVWGLYFSTHIKLVII